MRTVRVVKAEIPGQGRAGLRAVRVGVQVNLFVLDAAPQPLDEHVIDPAGLAVRADRDAGVLQNLDPFIAGELRALVGIEDLGSAELRQRLLERGDAEVRRVSVFESRNASTLRLATSRMATRYRKPWAIGRYG
jgi:hypothetical protein